MSAAEAAFDPAPGQAAGADDVLPEPVLAEPVRQRVITMTATALSAMAVDELPSSLRKVAKFAPQRRAKLGAVAIATQLSGDPDFRQRIGGKVLEDAGELGSAVRDGVAPAAADPVEVAALAYLTRPRRWRELVAQAGQQVAVEAENALVAQQMREALARTTRAEHDRAVARAEADKLRTELARMREELGRLREQARAGAKAARESQVALKRATELLAIEKGRAAKAAANFDAELRRLRAKLSDAEAAMGDARQAVRDARAVDEARLWLLLETIGQAASGLRRELALDPAKLLPADAVAAAHADTPTGQAPAVRGLAADDPARLNQLLALPKAHLIVDGYNVTKGGFAEISLEQQRNRLVAGLGGLAAQTGVEATVVFDGAERVHGLPPPPRGVRVLFSHKGETADELIRRLVRAEPPGRALIVVSSDREVADGVRRHGAYPMSSDSLLRRLARS